MAGWTQTSYV